MEKKEEIPRWVDLNSVSLDQFYTSPIVAKKYFNLTCDFLKKRKIDLNDCIFIEPSAGNGSFFNLLPKHNRIGLDLMPMHNGIKQADFLDWKMEKTNKKVIFIGNPPFGYRSWLALLFMNHAAEFADFICFILPMAFQSEGKGSPKNRVNGMKLTYSEIVPKNSFFEPNGSSCKINALFQIWEKGFQKTENFSLCDEYIDLFTIDNRPERLCGQDKKKLANFFLQRTYYSTPPTLVKNFKEVQYGCGYGIIIKKDKEKITQILESTNWDNYSNLAAHNCRHISMYHIKKAVINGGIDELRL